ncbi:N-acetylglucosamine-6-phosphate deacetylase [Arthrobacter sp. PM3]|uniref:N-acetylglucosamine-6-phosphate deacetylase n=1 Tax=Arthrobacter sp. PM3 TaxID=2017685 RepID=UPI000E10363F|nr:N-acetylglucosamine-6-phosphate deacetylase [Arthrobacter sp. PM3]AXJ09484.1 N-acetylglucosamine-6-phosphate deacetylase [Arthrobacter sp. PM3]
MTLTPGDSAAAPAPAYVLRGALLTDGDRTGEAVVAVAGGRIAYAGPAAGYDASQTPDAEELPLPAGTSLLPGLVDLHCHGAAGGGFPAGDEQACREAVQFLHRSGTTSLLASLVTASGDDLVQSLRILRVLASEGLIAGVHAEGPFLSAARCGAQNPRWLRDPDPELLGLMLAAAGGTLRTMTYAPELPGAADLLRMLTDHGVTPSLGHTDADARLTAESLTEVADLIGGAAAGGRFGPHARPTVTHLFNGMPPLHHRSPGPAGACLRLAAAGTVVVELIGDGVHLDPETVRMVFGLAGAANIALVTDSMAATGLPDGDYGLGPSDVVVRDGVATLKSDGALAGSTATLLDVVRTTIAAGVSPVDAVLAATLVPARVLGLDNEIGALRAGMRADILAVDAGFERVAVLRGGRILAAPA